MAELCALVDGQLLQRCKDGAWEHTGVYLEPSAILAACDREIYAVLNGHELWHAQLPSLHFTHLGPCFATPTAPRHPIVAITVIHGNIFAALLDGSVWSRPVVEHGAIGRVAVTGTASSAEATPPRCSCLVGSEHARWGWAWRAH